MTQFGRQQQQHEGAQSGSLVAACATRSQLGFELRVPTAMAADFGRQVMAATKRKPLALRGPREQWPSRAGYAHFAAPNAQRSSKCQCSTIDHRDLHGNQSSIVVVVVVVIRCNNNISNSESINSNNKD